MSGRIRTLICAAIGVLACPSAPISAGAARVARPPVAPAGEGRAVLLVPSAPAAAAYRAFPLAPERGRDSDSLIAAISNEVKRAAVAAGRPGPLRDRRLDRTAADLARWTVPGSLPSFDAVAFLLSHHGIVAPEPNLVVSRGSAAAEHALATELRRQVAGVLALGAWRRLGVGVHRGATEVVVVLALQEQNLELEAVPRRLPARGRATISGRLLGRLDQPELVVALPDGGVRRKRLPVSRGRFRAGLVCDAGKGTYQVEISGSSGRDPTVLANFPVYCGVEPPAGTSLAGVPVGSRQAPEAAERELHALVNRDRAAARLPPLELDARLARVARAYSGEMARTGRVAHVSASTGGTVERLRAAGIAPFPSRIAENVGRALSAAEVERGFMASPGHRANVMSKDVTRVGIGVVAGPGQDDTTPLYFTQIFAGWK